MSKLRIQAREFVIWRELQRGAQSHEEVAQATDLPLDFVKGTIRRKGWLFAELPASDVSPTDIPRYEFEEVEDE